jgi:glycosyltransferase involved in cell wall biosynthesis
MLPLSVIIPTYNRASLLEKTLYSLTRQSKADFQTIVVDHGSTDNTEEVCRRYSDVLRIACYKIDREDRSSPGVPRDFGVKKAEAPVIAFLDTGMIVPSRYIETHMAFHHLHKNSVGIGLQHGYQGIDVQYRDPKEISDEELATFLNRLDIDRAYSALKEAELRDQREGVELQNSSFPWFFGWTANLSLPREAYHSAGGFDLELKGWGFEDADLCYRISKLGLSFAFVEDGWGIELPQPRKPMQERFESNQKNMRHCYGKQRSLALESLLLTELLLRQAIIAYRSLPEEKQDPAAFFKLLEQMGSQFTVQAEEIFRYLATVRQESVALPAQVRSQFARPALLIGGTGAEAEWCDYVTLADERVMSTASIWSCCGILLPLADQSLGTVIVSDIWKRLDWSMHYAFGMPSVSLLEFLISEIQRTAREAIFVHSPSILPDRAGPSIEALESLCHKYSLSFRIVSPE